MRQVSELYEEAQRMLRPLMSVPNNCVFKDLYNTNHKAIDNAFYRKFHSFWYIWGNGRSVFEDSLKFYSEMELFLGAHAERYNQLFRAYTIEEYSLVDNYDATETMQKTTSGSGTAVVGARTDTTSETIGSRTDTTSESLGARTDSSTDNIGGRTDSGTTSNAAHTDTTTHKVDTFDNVNSNNGSDSTSYGAQSSTNGQTIGAQTNTNSTTVGSQSNSGSVVSGEQSNSGSSTFGEQTNTTNDSGSETYTMHRKGNIGVMTVDDMIGKHITTWTNFYFWDIVFADICKEYLLVDGGE